ncbi:MAG: RNA polymerase sigma factor [Candidatus Eisenbacteria bacterium]|uniref:RNA polymerase sigma factor n=1 Tax=Eiseniibacteriota bacterium TaxID=2212470 RepID=A0A956M004_UNCEI|nr:RNA polymerase sigma factor [Candidatus Eisenbacteria bacterium]
MDPAGKHTESSIELVRLAQDGDEAALERLCARYLPVLQRWAEGRLPGRARSMVETADLVQETFIRALRNLDGFEMTRRGALLSYLRTALFNRIRSELRKAGRTPEEVGYDESLNPASGFSPLEALIGAEDAERYESVLTRLTVNERETVIARLELGLPFGEVAAMTGKPSADAARMAFSRAVLRIAELWPDE